MDKITQLSCSLVHQLTVENMDRFQPHFGHFSKKEILELSQKSYLVTLTM